MDIDILLGLQDFRNGVGSFLADFLSKMTFFGELNTIIIIMAIVYWAVSKEYGTFFLMGWSGNRLVNGFLKVTFCAYRPWIRDPRIIPYGNSMTTATGYSFPSGHTMNAATVYGGSSLQKGLPKFLRIVLGILVAFIAFSRIYLGVHTPQDILVGAGAGILVMFLTMRLMKWLKEHTEKTWIIIGIGTLLAILVALYAGLKSYPVDYDADGNILVEGKKMMNDTFKGVGYCIAFLIGWGLEQRFVKFSTDISVLQRIIRIVIGLLGYYVVSLIICNLIKTWIPGSVGTLIACFLQVFYVTFLFPLSLKIFEKNSFAKPEKV
ncbi:MAG: phosphatase PAP2 family protein [Lachnospiraceae bacterium]|nr:phosphatase PAP2 family protein [Lachnospiraceae bacterium]